MRGTLQVLFGLAREIDLCWYLQGFLQQLCPAYIQNKTKSSAFSPFSLWALTWRDLRAGKLCSVGWTPALSPSPPLHLRRMQMFLENRGKVWCFTRRGSPVQNFSGRCYSVHAPCEGNTFKTGFPQIKALRISSLIQKYRSQTLGNRWLCCLAAHPGKPREVVVPITCTCTFNLRAHWFLLTSLPQQHIWCQFSKARHKARHRPAHCYLQLAKMNTPAAAGWGTSKKQQWQKSVRTPFEQETLSPNSVSMRANVFHSEGG